MLSGFKKPLNSAPYYSQNRPLNYAVFISGSGSTLQTLLELQHQFDIRLVVSSKKNALGLSKAKRFGKVCLILPNPIDFSKLTKVLQDFKIDRLFLAGFMKLLPEEFVHVWKNKIINIHPSLLPHYPGLQASLRNWKEQSAMGVSIHQVTSEMDKGPLLLQQCSLAEKQNYSLELSELFLRRTEQHLLRDYIFRWGIA